ncbi:MAG: cyclic-di-AMP receptor [Acutalibacteraceae bacterium]|jgi:uncharacterized protein YaaQ|nr:hypothetical protein [Clostridiales bacterium]
MKLLIAIVNKDDANKVADKLMNAGFFITKLSTTGGFLKSGNTTMISGVQEDKLEQAIEIIRKSSKRREVDMQVAPPEFTSEIFMPQKARIVVGGATVFVLDVEEFHKI